MGLSHADMKEIIVNLTAWCSKLGTSVVDRLVSVLFGIADGVVRLRKSGYGCAGSRNHRLSMALPTVDET